VHVGAAVAQPEEGAVVGGALGDDRGTGGRQLVEEEGVGLHRAVGDQHVLDRDAVFLGDPPAQRHVADRRPVAGHPRRVAVEGRDGGLLEALDVDDVGRRGAAREGDHGAGR
jgi:hypothetical protein